MRRAHTASSAPARSSVMTSSKRAMPGRLEYPYGTISPSHQSESKPERRGFGRPARWRRPGTMPALRPVAQRLDQQGEGRRVLPAARVVEVIAGIRWTPVGEHPDEAALGDMRLHLV